MVWKYPSLARVATLTGHNMRVLYLAMSPDGQTVVTGAGDDETLCFWNIFPSMKTPDLLKVYKETRNGMLGLDYSTKFSP
ncbi:hypothetical protein S83_032517 [Arachis hypogaea]